MRFLKWKYGLEQPPEDTKAKTLEDVKKEDELLSRARAGKLSEKTVLVKGANIRNFKVYVGDEVYDIGVEAEGNGVFTPPQGMVKPFTSSASPVISSRQAENVRSFGKSPAPAAKPSGNKESPVQSPMPGIVIKYEVQVGSEVQADDPIVILEAMKMENVITAPVSGKIKALNFKNGDRVAKDAVLAVIVS
jgi:biotin carboxyl carrier protein